MKVYDSVESIPLLPCPGCGEDCIEFLNAPHFRVTASGQTPNTPDGPGEHWFEGELTCPKCGEVFDVADST